MGECLVGGTKIGKFLIKNDGGSGKFCFIPKQIWPVTNFKVLFGAVSEYKMISKLHLRQCVYRQSKCSDSYTEILALHVCSSFHKWLVRKSG